MSIFGPARRRPSTVLAIHDVRVFAAFCLLGFANTVLPPILFSASYLIIPFPRPLVLLIETLPALLTTLLLPHLLPYVAYSLRPVLLAGTWALAGVIATATPPNVAPPARVLVCLLASAGSAAGEMCFLGLLPYYGKGRMGLVGWGLGTGFGGVFCALMPYLLTVRMGMFLRDALQHVHYLAVLLLAAYFIVLPWTPLGKPGIFFAGNKSGLGMLPEHATPLDGDPSSLSGGLRRMRADPKLLRPLQRQFTIPLAAFALHSMILPGVARAHPVTPLFDNYASFKTLCALAVQLGSLVGRLSILISRAQNTRLVFTALTACTAASLLNGVFLATTSPGHIFALALCVGLASGAVYVNVFARALEQLSHESSTKWELSISTICAGETTGALLGSLIASGLEAQLCGTSPLTVDRWCFTIK